MDNSGFQTWQWPPTLDTDVVRLKAELAVANMRLQSVERQRDSARRVARALLPCYGFAKAYYWGVSTETLDNVHHVLAEEARREKELGA